MKDNIDQMISTFPKARTGMVKASYCGLFFIPDPKVPSNGYVSIGNQVLIPGKYYSVPHITQSKDLFDWVAVAMKELIK